MLHWNCYSEEDHDESDGDMILNNNEHSTLGPSGTNFNLQGNNNSKRCSTGSLYKYIALYTDKIYTFGGVMSKVMRGLNSEHYASE